jgi:hypothetical protein
MAETLKDIISKLKSQQMASQTTAPAPVTPKQKPAKVEETAQEEYSEADEMDDVEETPKIEKQENKEVSIEILNNNAVYRAELLRVNEERNKLLQESNTILMEILKILIEGKK